MAAIVAQIVCRGRQVAGIDVGESDFFSRPEPALFVENDAILEVANSANGIKSCHANF